MAIESQKGIEAKQNFQSLLREVFGDNAPKDTKELRADLEKKKQSMTYNIEFKGKIHALLQMVKRKENREARFAEAAAKNGEKFKDKTVDTIAIRDLYEMNDTDAGFISRTFAYKMNQTDGSQEPYDINQALQGDEVLIDFGSNKNADLRIGAGDMIPARFSVVKITDANGVERFGKRQSKPRPGYYDETGYIPVYSGYKIYIPKDEELKTLDGFKKLNVTSVTPKTPEEMELFKKYEAEEAASLASYRKLLKNEVSASIDDSLIDNGENLKGEALWNSFAFQAKLSQVCEHLGVSKEDMKLVMKAESGLNPKIVNKGSGATGLIQFMPSTAESLGVTTGMLRAMPSWEQLDYVEKYFKPFVGRLHSAYDLYTVTFYPVALGKPDDYVLGSESKNPDYASLVARQNPGIAKGNETITVDTFRKYVEGLLV